MRIGVGRSIEFPHEMLLASKDKLDFVVEFIKNLSNPLNPDSDTFFL